MNSLFTLILSSLRRCKVCIISIFITYCFSCTIGFLMVQSGNDFALSQRDRIVGTAVHHEKAAINYLSGNKLTAALYDFTGNLFLGAVPQTALGLSILVPYFTVLYQGWVGGIVSVDNSHHNRLDKIKTAFYYIIVLLLQLIPYSLSIGAGVKFGVEVYKQNMKIGWKFWRFRIRKENLLDIRNIYLISIPLFFIASLFEFFSSWNI
ncbi:MAG: stage II sporulation protein M [Ignavibacteriaceae bacterium]